MTYRLFLNLFIAISTLSCLLDSPRTSKEAARIQLEAQPPSPLDQMGPVVHFRVRGLNNTDTQPKLRVYRGDLSSSQLQRIWDDDPSKTVLEREVEPFIWHEDADSLGVALPQVWPAGLLLSVVTFEPTSHHRLRVAEAASALPVARLRWPTNGIEATSQFAIYCSEGALPSGIATFVPQQQSTQLSPGAGPGDPNPNCLHGYGIRAQGPWTLPRAQLLDPAGRALAWLDPAAIQNEQVPPPPTPGTACPETMQTAIGGCIEVEDDRIHIRNQDRPMFWSVVPVQPALAPHYMPLQAKQSMLIHPLDPSSHVELFLTSVDAWGHSQGLLLRLQTKAPRARVIINEVLANPVGPEPQQEWIELYNDGLATANLGLLALEDIGGRIQLPAAELAPGSYAILVNDDYDPSGEYDPKPAQTARVIRLPQLGKDGLKNSGEPLKLVAPHGHVVSRFPANPKPKSGRSVYRIHPHANDTNRNAFALSEEGMSTPGSANTAAESAVRRAPD